jgi:signal transduction histidine kinase
MTGPGPATDSAPTVPSAPATTARRPSELVRAFVRSPLEPASWWATVAIFLGLFIAALAAGLLSFLFSTGGSLLIWLVGIPFIALGLELSRVVARVERWRMRLVDPRPLVPHPYRPLNGMPRAPYGEWLRTWAEAEFLDANRWRDVVYVLVLLPLAILEFAVSIGMWVTAVALLLTPIAVVLVVAGFPAVTRETSTATWAVGAAASFLVGVVLVPVAASVSRGLVVLHRAVVQGLLCVDPTEGLRRDVERLRESRSAAIEAEASELRRIERDIHDGAQQRLVSLTIDLGRAEERIDTDPAAAKAIIAEARVQARTALSELRALVRGTMPAILVDRGLDAALASVAASCPVPTTLDSSLAAGERLSPAVERAAYFVVVEALANVAKHSGASRAEVRLLRGPSNLAIEVHDDGTGGADLTPGGGLAGLRDRVAALDGSLTVTSPAGGPTEVRAQLPLSAV